MARTLNFALAGREYATAPAKIDRAKLYGRTETVALDADGNPCELVLIDPSGTLLIPSGGTGMGLLAEDGRWVDRSQLVPTSTDGAPVESAPSSFDAPVPLQQTATAEELLDTAISGVYELGDDPDLIAALGDQIFGFEYRFRAGPAGSDAFVLASGGTAFMLVGQKLDHEWLGLDGAADDLEEEPEDDDELDDLDFGMF
ncbi:MAG: hypothetical protein QM804_06825 [Propionicimonas sp.]